MSTQRSLPRWYLIQCKPRQDARAEENLIRQDFNCFRPTKLLKRTSEQTESLFPGYLFIRLDKYSDNWHPIRSTRGVSRLVTFGHQPIAVPDEVVHQLQQKLGNFPASERIFNPGDTVRINAGSLKDLDAIFLSRDGNERVLILLKLLNREHSISLSLDDIDRSEKPQKIL
ncbi:Transcription antitermination protein RfaH [compost metagenome]